MKLINLSVEGLFGYFNHKINFDESNVTIVTAPNGYGKTVCLKIIESIFNKDFNYFKRIEFKRITLYTESGYIQLNKDIKSEIEDHQYLEVIDNNKNVFPIDKVSLTSLNFPLSAVERFLPFLNRIEKDLWEDSRTDDVIDIAEIVLRYSDYLPDTSFDTDIPQWLNDFCNLLKVHFIQDQRLITKENSDYNKSRRGIQHTETIIMYAKELGRMITNIGLESAAVSQVLDSSFPVRLMRKKKNIKSIEDIKTELNLIQKRREELSLYGLINSHDQLPQLNNQDEIREEDTKVLTLYIEDTIKKLENYNDIYNKINLFATLVKNKNLTHKEIKFSQEKGFYFVPQYNNDNNQQLPLSQLSSGEQHQIVLLYELIFKVSPNTLILIDEPEISLHVAWQKEFLNDLKEIINLQKMSVIMATHSPTIVGANWHLVTDLEGDSDL